MNEEDMSHAVGKHFMALAAQVVRRSCFAGCICTVPYTAAAMNPRTLIGHLDSVSVSRRKVTSWRFISRGILSTALVKLLNLSCRPIRAPAKNMQLTVNPKLPISSSDHVATTVNPKRDGSKLPVTRTVGSKLPDINYF